jgi:maleylacetate reductase
VKDRERDFTFRDGSRTIRFAAGAVGEAAALVDQAGFADWVLLTTERARADVPDDLLSAAAEAIDVPEGPVPDIAAAVRDQVGGRPVVAFGGGRVVDAAKALAAADGTRVVAVPTTLAGSTFTPFHRMPAGMDGYGSARPQLAVCDPGLMASAPREILTATAMNALAHATEALYAPGANPVTEGAALRGASLIAEGLRGGESRPEPLSLGGLLGGYAVGVAMGMCVHHAVCQTTVRVAGTPHAPTNAVMLPHSIAFMAGRAPEQVDALAGALGGGDPSGVVAELAAGAGPRTLSDLGLDPGRVPEIVEATLQHPGVGATPGGPIDADDLRGLLEAAL